VNHERRPTRRPGPGRPESRADGGRTAGRADPAHAKPCCWSRRRRACFAAFWAIGDTFLIVFIGIFLALVFEYPVRFLMSKTNFSRGVAAAVTVLGTAVLVLIIALLFLVPSSAASATSFRTCRPR
jgi:hypothetical protein